MVLFATEGLRGLTGFIIVEDYIGLMANVGNHTESVHWLLAPATLVVHRPNMKKIPAVTACTEYI